MSPCERIVRRFFDAFQHGELGRMLAMLHPDAVVVPAAPIPGRVRFEGAAEIREWARWAIQRRPVMVGRTDAFRTLDDDHVLVSGRVRVPDEDGGYADRAVTWVVEVVGGKVRRLEARWTEAEALALHGDGPG